MTAALEGGEWLAARPGRTLPPGKTRYRFYRSLGGSRRAENFVPTGIRSRTVQPVVSRYTTELPGPLTLCNTVINSWHLENRSAFIFKAKQIVETLKWKALRFFRNSSNTHLNTQRHISEDFIICAQNWAIGKKNCYIFTLKDCIVG